MFLVKGTHTPEGFIVGIFGKVEEFIHCVFVMARMKRTTLPSVEESLLFSSTNPVTANQCNLFLSVATEHLLQISIC